MSPTITSHLYMYCIYIHYISHLFFSVRHILNVTREIDNFFPGSFNYLNVRVYDDDKTDLLKHWDNTYKYITKAEYVDCRTRTHL